MSQREYINWRKYWDAEPWGSWRDNMHAAIIAREIRRPQLKKGARVSIDDFMMIPPEHRQQQAKAHYLGLLKLLSGGKKSGG